MEYHELGNVERVTPEPRRAVLLRFTWGVQVVRYPNFFLGEWKQIET